MYRSPADPRHEPPTKPTGWRSVAAAYLLAAAVPALVLVVSRPLLGVTVIAAHAALAAGARRAVRALATARERRLSVDLPGGVRFRLAVSRPAVERSNSN